ncbi:MAG: glycosyltransferase [Opitutaceae bacterium]|nr:glycosyltransferase [Opitutaceae bacterium]
MNENDSYLFDIEQPSDWVFGSDPVWISGWLLSKRGAGFSDIRAVIDGIHFLGILGLPRDEIETKFRGHHGLPHPGFLLRVRPPSGAKLLRLEVLDAGGAWVEIWRTKIRVHLGQGKAGRYNLSLLPDHLHRLLQQKRAEPHADLRPLAEKLAREGASVPLDTLPNPPFFGALEKPELVGGTQFGKVRVEGWIIHQNQRIRRLLGSTHPLVENELDFGTRERLEAAELFPDHPHARLSQYFGMLDIDETPAGPAILKLFAELEDGSKHLVFARRFHQRSCNQWEQPIPAFDRRLFLGCARELMSAARRQKIRLGSLRAIWHAIGKASRTYRRHSPAQVPASDKSNDQYKAWCKADRITPRLREHMEKMSRQLVAANVPRISVIVDTRECDHAQLTRLSESITSQLYPQWDAWFVGTASPLSDERLRHESIHGRKDVVRAFQTALDKCQGQLVTLVPGNSRLSPDALLEVAHRVSKDPDLELVYTDEDRVDADGHRSEPNFKPDWSPTLLLSGLYPGALSVIPRKRLIENGGFREGFDAVLWHDVLLRVCAALPSEKVAHLPIVAHHGWAGTGRGTDLAHPSYEQGRRALADAATRLKWPATSFLPEVGHHRRERFHQLRWDKNPSSQPSVTIVIPTRDHLHLLQECVELIEETVDWSRTRLVIVDDHSRDADAVHYLERIQRRTDIQCIVARLPDPSAPFNYSKLVNAALPHIETPLVLHLNNDVNALEPGWLEEMTAWFTFADVGVVGAKLIYPDRSLNHTGIVIGPHGGLADTPFAKVPEDEVPLAWHAATREVSAVTGACLLTRTDLYRQLGGFDETDFGVAYNDVDYCLRARAAGYRVLYTPQAKLMHWGSATRGVTFNETEHIAFVRSYPAYRDPYLSPHWQLDGSRLSSTQAGPDRSHLGSPPRMLLLTHNLNLEGAPLFLLEYATYMGREAGFQLEVISAQEGPLREQFTALGASLTLVDTAPIFGSADAEIFHAQISDIAHRIDWDKIDLVVCNTLQCFWGIHLASSANKPSLLYIHESTSIFRFFEEKMPLALHGMVAQALADSTRSLFLCQATRAYYEDCNLRDNFRIVPSWINLPAIDTYRSAHPRAALRERMGYAEDDIVIANIGTICERKGQHIFIRAIRHFLRQGHPGKFRFVMVGARPGIYLDLLVRDIKHLGIEEHITLIPETRAVFDHFISADMFVCTSYEESFPRVVMEAMAFRTPIISTDVHGIAEMIGQRQQGYLVKPGDHLALSKMMWTCLAKERSGKSLTPTAYSKALRCYDMAKVLPLHAQIAHNVALTGA